MPSGSFTDGAGRGWDFEIIEVHTFDGEVYVGDDIVDHLEDADRVFYSVQDSEGLGETFYRYIGGPFDDIYGVEAAIEDDGDFYADAA